MSDKVLQFDDYKSKSVAQEKFFLEVTQVIVNGEIIDFVHIFQTQPDGFSKISIYSRYFTSRVLGESILNKSTNTKVNAHGKFIVSFLNYIFYESNKKINKIQELDRDLIIEFLNRYARGQTSNQKGKWINKDSSIKAGKAIMRFVYWLKYSRLNNGATLGLNKITKSDFDISTKIVNKTKIIASGETKESHYTVQTIECPPDFKKTSKQSGTSNEREKAVELSLYTIKLLIDASRKYDKQMTLAIVLGAFVGLRQGDVVQMNRHRLSLPIDLDITSGCTIDLKEEVQISENTHDTGRIKTHRLQPIYEAFLPTVSKAYNGHLELLKSRGLDSHKYGALFFNNRDNGVMRQKSLNLRFASLVDKVIDKLAEEALVNKNEYAIKDYNIIANAGYKITFHSLRYFYTQALERLEDNPFTIMRYRGDGALESQNTYRGNMNTIEGIKRVMDEMEGELKKYGFDEL